jgi:two-component system LytT family sensor kinase
MDAVPPPATGLFVDVIGFLTGSVLYVMLIVMVWRECVAERRPFLSRRGRLPLLTGVFGLVWNLGALVSFGARVMGGAASPALVAVTFGALGCLPAVVVHSLVEGRAASEGRAPRRWVAVAAYGLSAAAFVMHLAASAAGQRVPSSPALWTLTAGFTLLTGLLLVGSRRQSVGRQGIWVAPLAIFAVSALHFGNHGGDETWWVELIGHHASLPLALAILHQDYRFALADLFLKNAIALLLLMGLSIAVLSGLVVPLSRWAEANGSWDPRAVAVLVALWMGTALVFPVLRRLAAQFVDRAVLRRPDYARALADLARRLEAAETEADVATHLATVLRPAFGVADERPRADPLPVADDRLVVAGSDLRSWTDASAGFLLRLRTVDAPHVGIAMGPMEAGRRLLSDDLRLLESASMLASRRIDALRVAQERMTRNLREQAMQRLATEAELRALRAQLNPHFLFNALTTIGYLIRAAPERALDTLLRLTDVLRGVLRRSTTEFSPLGDEVDFIRSYLDIEKARFEERLTVAIDMPADARLLLVPSLLLQPLVENAVKHGLATRRAGGTVRMRAWVESDLLHISVEDTGIGFDPAAARAPAGFGLASVEQRLRAHYGAAAFLQVTSERGRGTRVELRLPAVGPARPRAGLAGRLVQGGGR